MSEELIECSCCGKLVPAEELELVLIRPDDVATLSSQELEVRCVETKDVCVLDGERFFIRCVIPLPVHQSAHPYSIGAWTEISERDYDRIHVLWEEEDLSAEPAIEGVLANQISLTIGSLGCRVAVQLVGAKTRPFISILDEACSLYCEQKDGVPMHRASAYSDLIRPSVKDKNALVVAEEQEMDVTACTCCDRTLRCYRGHITAGRNGDVRADYWLRIPEGHGGFCMLAVSIEVDAQPRVAVMTGEASDDGITYRLLDGASSPWGDFGEYGRVMDRREVLDHPAKSAFFQMADAITAADTRLVAHTTPYLQSE